MKLWRRRATELGGGVDVLVGVDGSRESHAAISAVCALFGAGLGRLTLAAVVRADASADEEDIAGRRLEAAAEWVIDQSFDVPTPETRLLHGVPPTALRQYVRTSGYDVLAVGSHGIGRSKAVLGSTASGLIERADVPLIVTPSGTAEIDLRSLSPSPPTARAPSSATAETQR
jgi:nucleotide-binding universal stress UspA family protein